MRLAERLGRSLRRQTYQPQPKNSAGWNLQGHGAAAVPAPTAALRLDADGGNIRRNFIFLDNIMQQLHQAFLFDQYRITRCWHGDNEARRLQDFRAVL